MGKRASTRHLGPWVRIYVSILDDPKLARLSDAQYRGWHKMIALAKFHGGTIPPDIYDISHRLRLAEGKARDLLQVLVSAKLFDQNRDGYTPHNWDERQFESDVSTGRVKRFRNRTETVNETFHETPDAVSETVNETPPDTETETDTETEPEKSSAPPLAAPLTIPPDPERKPPQAKGRRWADDETIPPNWLLEAQNLRAEHSLPAINLPLEADKFANYWASKTGRGATHADWKRTWLNWALSSKNESNGATNGRRISAHDKGTLGAAMAIAEYELSRDGGGTRTPRDSLPPNGHGRAQMDGPVPDVLGRLPAPEPRSVAPGLPELPAKS